MFHTSPAIVQPGGRNIPAGGVSHRTHGKTNRKPGERHINCGVTASPGISSATPIPDCDVSPSGLLIQCHLSRTDALGRDVLPSGLQGIRHRIQKTLTGYVWYNESRGGEEGEKKSQDSTRRFARLLPIERNKNLTSNPQYITEFLIAQH